MSTVRVAIIGLGRMASTIDDEVAGYPAVVRPYSIAASCAASERLEVVAGCDLLADKREAFRQRWGVTALFDDYQPMIRDVQPDLVAICTRGENHARLAVAVAEMDVPAIFCEKAMACSLREADAVLEAVGSRQIPFNTGVLRRYNPRYEQIRDLIAEGGIGTPKVAVHYASTSLLHGHSHSIDTLLYLLGDPHISRVWGELRPRDLVIENARLDQDPGGIYRLDTDSGVECYSLPMGNWEFEVLGTDGVVRSTNNGADWEHRRKVPVGERFSTFQRQPVPDGVTRSATVVLLENLADALAGTAAPREGVAHAHHVTEACLAVAESHRQGNVWLELPLAERDLYVWHV